jgi:hypothetical protein
MKYYILFLLIYPCITFAQDFLEFKRIGYHTYYYKRNELKCTITFYTNQECKAIISKDKKDELGNFIISKREKYFFTIEGFSPGIIFYVEGNEIIYVYYLPLKYGNTPNILDLRYDDFLKLQTIDELIKSIYFYKCLRMGGSIDSCY